MPWWCNKHKTHSIDDSCPDCDIEYNLETSAYDHAILLDAMISGVARWEPFEGSSEKGEVCVNGLRYTTCLDEFRCPQLTSNLRAEIIRAIKKKYGRSWKRGRLWSRFNPKTAGEGGASIVPSTA